jgi:hypothetical protein
MVVLLPFANDQPVKHDGLIRMGDKILDRGIERNHAVVIFGDKSGVEIEQINVGSRVRPVRSLSASGQRFSSRAAS